MAEQTHWWKSPTDKAKIMEIVAQHLAAEMPVSKIVNELMVTYGVCETTGYNWVEGCKYAKARDEWSPEQWRRFILERYREDAHTEHPIRRSAALKGIRDLMGLDAAKKASIEVTQLSPDEVRKRAAEIGLV